MRWYNLVAMTTTLPKLADPQTRRWTREEFYRLAEEGWFRGQRVQLVEGEIIQMPPQGHAHAKALTFLTRWLQQVFDESHLVRIQMPLNVLDDSDPEPDAAVVQGPATRYSDHPEVALLVIEVSDSSVRLDRRKAALYAAANVPEDWIINIVEREVEIYRSPDPKSRHYAHHEIVKGNQQLAPQARPGALIEAEKLFG